MTIYVIPEICSSSWESLANIICKQINCCDVLMASLRTNAGVFLWGL